MKIGPKFKIAKRLGAPIFPKTQTAKFALSEAKTGRLKKRRGNMSDYNRQLIEKQKMRYTYGISEKHLRRYVDEAILKSQQPIAHLMERLESRLDNVVFRMGIAKSRQQSRQMVSHGHVVVNGKKITSPSHKVRQGDEISVREGSKQIGLLINIGEEHAPQAVPGWLKFDLKSMTGTVASAPAHDPTESMFDPEQVLEYYSR